MSKPFILPSAASPFEQQTAAKNEFVKDVLIEGVYQHPVEPWEEPLVVDKARIERLCEASNKAITLGQKSYVPDTHSTRAEDNVGFAVGYFPRLGEDGKWRAAARLRIEDESYVPKIGTTIRDVSPLIVDWPLGSGESLGERFEHVALCPDPVMPGQGNFVACSTGRGSMNTVDVPVLRTVTQEPPSMKIKVTDKNIKALSLAGLNGTQVGAEVDVTPEAFEAALAAVAQAHEQAASLNAASDKAQENLKAEKALSIEKRLSVDPKTPYYAEANKHRADAIKTRLDVAMSKGRLTKPVRDAMERLLSVRFAYAMSVETGVATPVDVEKTVNEIVDAIPDNALVPVGTTTEPAGSRPPNEPPKFDGKAEADKTLERLGMKKPAAPKK